MQGYEEPNIRKIRKSRKRMTFKFDFDSQDEDVLPIGDSLDTSEKIKSNKNVGNTKIVGNESNQTSKAPREGFILKITSTNRDNKLVEHEIRREKQTLQTRNDNLDISRSENEIIASLSNRAEKEFKFFNEGKCMNCGNLANFDCRCKKVKYCSILCQENDISNHGIFCVSVPSNFRYKGLHTFLNR